jgi:hypothetical protein
MIRWLLNSILSIRDSWRFSMSLTKEWQND